MLKQSRALHKLSDIDTSLIDTTDVTVLESSDFWYSEGSCYATFTKNTGQPRNGYIPTFVVSEEIRNKNSSIQIHLVGFWGITNERDRFLLLQLLLG